MPSAQTTASAKTQTPSSGIPGLPGAVGLGEYDRSSLPGDPARGLEIFRSFCSGCHNFKAAGIQGGNKPGSDLDARKPTFTQIVRLIVQGGGGGLPSKLLLKQLNFQQIYDVAAFVALYADSTRPVRGASKELPTPEEIAAPLRTTAGAAPIGRFRATVSGRAMRWRLTFYGANATNTVGRIQFAGADRPIQPVVLDCDPCQTPGNGFLVLTPAQAAALKNRRTVIVVKTPDNTLRGPVSKIA